MQSKHKIFGICTDTVQKGGKILLKDGKRQYGAVGWYRIVNPLEKMGANIAIGTGLKSTPENALEFKEKGDIWYSKISDNEGIDHIYGAHKEFTGCKLVIDLDDDPRNVNEDHPDYRVLKEKEDMRVRMIKLADHIVVATPLIKESIKDLTQHVTVIPNAIDPKLWRMKNKKRSEKVRIGWMSSGSHFSDVPIIQPVMDAILKKYPHVEFHFAGMTWENTKQDRFYHHTGRAGYRDFPRFYAKLGIDISVAPLKDTQFNRCKSNIKWMEAAMLGIPTVASDVEPYKCIRHSETGYLATSTQQWIKYLSWLIEDKDLREKIGRQAKKEVMDNYTTDKVLPLYEDLFDKLQDKKELAVITAITEGKDELKDQPYYKGVEYLAFTDTKDKHPTWKTKKACDKFKNPVMNAKIHKILSHKYTDLPYIIWMDGSLTLKQNPHELVKLMGDKDFAFFKHPGRDCLYDEADMCVGMGKGNRQELAEQITAYAKQDFPPHSGLCECTAFIRKNIPEVNAIFEKWWADITRYSERDQVSFPISFKGQSWSTIPGSVEELKGNPEFPGNKYFKYQLHKK